MARRRASAIALTSMLVLSAPTLAAAQVVPGSDGTEPARFVGPCETEGRILETGSAIDPAASGGVYEIPAEATFSYRSALGSRVERPMDGEVFLLVPPPIDEVRVIWWDERNRATVERGTYNYRISEVVAPLGIEVALRVTHVDAEVSCETTVHLRLAGSFWDGFLRPAVAAVTVVPFVGMIFCGRRRRDSDDTDRLGVSIGF